MKKVKFLNLIQIHATAYASSMLNSKSNENNLLYLDGLDQIQNIPEDYIPEDYLFAAKEFIEFWFPKKGLIDIRKKPQWLIDYDKHCIDLSFETGPDGDRMYVYSESQFREFLLIGQYKRKFVKLISTNSIIEYTNFQPHEVSFNTWIAKQQYKDYIKVGYGRHDHYINLSKDDVRNYIFDHRKDGSLSVEDCKILDLI